MPDKFMREIDEILERVERGGAIEGSKDEDGPATKRRTLQRLLPGPIWRDRFTSVSPGKVMLAGIALLLLAVVILAFADLKMFGLLWAGLVLFVIAYGMFFMRPGGAQYQKRWRGHLVEDRRYEPLWHKVKRWLRG